MDSKLLIRSSCKIQKQMLPIRSKIKRCPFAAGKNPKLVTKKCLLSGLKQ
jgi:hypothetical protein